MLVNARYHKLDLPIYPAETLVAVNPEHATTTDRSFEQVIAEAAGSTVVRAVGIDYTASPMRELDIKYLLRRTTEELEEVAEQTDSQIIRPRWGLYPIAERPVSEYEYYQIGAFGRTSIPSEYILVAEVDIVRDASEVTQSSRCYRRIKRGVDRYNELKGMRLLDVSTSQFIEGLTDEGAAADSAKTDYYVDIEPRFWIN